MKTRLGLDIGTNSIGWCLLELDEDNEPVRIENTGARIFSDGRAPKSLTTLKASRRLARSARRQRDRYLQRRKNLMTALVQHGLMPKASTERKALENKDPYSIRKKAISEEVPPFEIGRALFHLNQRRGFKSNRKTADSDTGPVKQSIKDLKQIMKSDNASTLGEFLASRRNDGKTVRARRQGPAQKDLYDLYPDRAMYEKEFDMIWSKQAEYDREFYDAEKCAEIKKIIFNQRPLKPQKVGRCTFLPKEERIAKALPSYQRFRIYQELANLKWIDDRGRGHAITQDSIDILANDLKEKPKLSFIDIGDILKKIKQIDYPITFNLESKKRKALDGNQTSCEMRDESRIGDKWDKWDEQKQDELITLLLDDNLEDGKVREKLIDEYGIAEDRVDAVLNAKLTTGHGMLSKAAIDKILPVMRDQDLQYWAAVKKLKLSGNPYDSNKPLDDRLDYYGKVLSGDVLPGTGDDKDKDEKRYGIISNPTVHIALNQIRQVVNELIRRYGKKPDQVVIELARDLPLGPDGRQEIITRQEENQERNDAIREELIKIPVDDNPDNRQKYQLWQELAEKPTDRQCVFCGKIIAQAQLFSPKIEIEHLLPFSRTLDDAMSNKTVCCRQCNRNKGNRSPYEAFGDSPDSDWTAILERANKFPKNKIWRFWSDAMDQFEDKKRFLARHINDTGYISRSAKKYLSSVVDHKNIWVVTGRLTALLRGHWELNDVLRGGNTPADQRGKKSRDDHRHHAIDAIVIAMTSRKLVQEVSNAAKHSEGHHLKKLFIDHKSIYPWNNFYRDVKEQMKKLIVSHRPRHKKQGALHRDEAYGIDEDQNAAVHRVMVESIIASMKNISKDELIRKKLNSIKDELIREKLNNETDGLEGKDITDAIQKWCRDQGIRRLKCYYYNTAIENMIPIKDKNGKAFKYFEGNSNAYIDIYADPKTGKWLSEVVSRFNANKPKNPKNPKGFTPKWQKKYPTAEKIMTLRKNDTVKIDTDDGSHRFYRVQKMNSTLGVTLALIHEANVAKRNKNITRKAAGLQKANACKVYISPTGLVREEK